MSRAWRPWRKLKEQIETARNELVQVQRRGEYQRAGELAYGVIPISKEGLPRLKQNVAVSSWTKG